jgi:hypothetical protein
VVVADFANVQQVSWFWLVIAGGRARLGVVFIARLAPDEMPIQSKSAFLRCAVKA